MINVLITGVGGPTPLGIAKSLLMNNNEYNINLIGVDADPLAPGLYNNKLFSKTYRVPDASHQDYWPVITGLIQKENIHFAIPVPETEIIEWAKFLKENTLSCQTLIPDYEIAQFLFNKLRVSEALVDHGLAPETHELHDIDDAKLIGDKLGYPYWVRVKSGAGALGSFKINRQRDIENWLKVNPGKTGFIASPFLPGRNYACKILLNEGDVVMAATGERIGYLLSSSAPSGISGMCAHGRLINDTDLFERAKKALDIIFNQFGKKPHGMFTIDSKASQDNIPYITEINLRAVSFTHAFSMAGANFAKKTLEVFYLNQDYKSHFHYFDKDYRFIRGVDSDLFLIEEEKLL